MQAKSFLFMSIVVVVVVAIVTSLIGVRLMQPVLLAPYQLEEEGLVSLTGGIGAGVTNVILIDESIDMGGAFDVDDRVYFTVNKNEGAETMNDSSAPGFTDSPFVIRNEGDDPAHVKVYADTNNLFDYNYNTDPTGADGSYLKFWIEPGQPLFAGPISGYDEIDNCALNGPCFVSTPCTFASRCLLPTSADAGTTDMRTTLPIADDNAINTLYAPADYDEALLHVEIFVNQFEGIGPKDTTIVVKGVTA